MSVSYVDGAVMNEATPSTTGTITIPSTVVAGHDLYISLTSRGHLAATALCVVTDDDTGGNAWTFEGSDDLRKGQLFWKKGTVGTASKTITVTGAVTTLCGVVAVYAGGAAGDPTMDFSFESNTSPDKSHASYTPTNSDSMVCLSICDQSNAVAVTGVTATTPATLTIRQEDQNAAASGATVTHASGAQVGATSATGTINWTMASNQSTKSLAWTIKAATTRFYFTRAASGESPAPVVPAIDAGWNSVQGPLQSCRASKILIETLGGFGSIGGLLGTTSTTNVCFGQWVSGPLDVNQTISGTVNMVQSVLEVGAAENAHLAFALRVVSVDGTVVRGTLATKYVTATEFNTSLETRSWSGVALTPVNALATDRLVFEIGVHAVTPANVNNVIIGTAAELGFGEYPSATDGQTTSFNGWWEITQAITFSPYLVWGTATTSANESDIVAGAKKIIIEVDTDAWVSN